VEQNGNGEAPQSRVNPSAIVEARLGLLEGEIIQRDVQLAHMAEELDRLQTRIAELEENASAPSMFPSTVGRKEAG